MSEGVRTGGDILCTLRVRRLLESRAELHDVRDFLGHASIATTSRYLRSTSLRLERALTLMERGHIRTGATPVPHEASDTGSSPRDETRKLMICLKMM